MRLTENGMAMKNSLDEKENQAALIYNKLGQLEDIEDELGIDLIILFSALKNGVYYFTTSGQLTRDSVSLISDYLNTGFHEKLAYSFLTGFEKRILLFKDYGITWTLTAEELV